MPKLTLKDAATLQELVATINNNNQVLEIFLDKVLSRDGQSPNSMEADLDMNSRRILNLPAPVALTDPVRFQDIGDLEDLNGVNLRQKITGTQLDIFVDASNGNDVSGDGRTQQTAFKTIQRAVNSAISDYDFRPLPPTPNDGVFVNIQLLDGIHIVDPVLGNSGVELVGMPVGKFFELRIVGNGADPSLTVIRGGAGSLAAIECELDCFLILNNVRIENPNGHGIYAKRGATIYFGGGTQFGACAEAQIFAEDLGSVIPLTSAYSIVGDAKWHIRCVQGSFVRIGGITVTLDSIPNFSDAFIGADHGGLVEWVDNTLVGTATGRRFNLNASSTLKVGTRDRTILPGSIEGDCDAGSIYGFGNETTGYGACFVNRDGSGSQTGLTGGVENVCSFPNKLFDSDGVYNTGTNRYQPLVRGIYSATLSVRSQAGSVFSPAAVISKNGTTPLYGNFCDNGVAANANYCSKVTGLFQMNGTTDFLEPRIFLPTEKTSMDEDLTASHFMVHLVRPF